MSEEQSVSSRLLDAALLGLAMLLAFASYVLILSPFILLLALAYWLVNQA